MSESTEQVTTKNKKRRNYLSYPYDYYTGSSVRIFFGHVWVDDIITIQYSMNQNKTPLYGYASQKFDAVAKGQILVQGNFTIAFKEAGYLNVVHNYFQDLKNDKKGKDKNEVLHYWLSKNKPIEQILDELYMSGESASDFEDLSEALEDYVWRDFGTPSRSITRPDEFDYGTDGGIDLSGFDIVMTFGDYTDGEAEHTVKVINDVHIIGESMVVTPDGSPIGLNYTFFARSIDENISNVYNIPEEKKPAGLNGDNEIDNKLDAEYPDGYWETMILDAYDKTAEKINSLLGRDFYETFGIDKLSSQYETRNAIKTLNVNNTESLKTIRSNIKNNLLSAFNNVNLNTYSDGYFKNLQILKLSVSIEILGNRILDLTKTPTESSGPAGPQNEDADKPNERYLPNTTRTLEHMQFKLMGDRWVDFSDDDEYNMKAQGVSDPDDLNRYNRTNSEGKVEQYSQNQRNAEVKASANLDTLKMIYSSEKTSTLEEELKKKKEDELFEKEYQDDLNLEFTEDYIIAEQNEELIDSAERKDRNRLRELRKKEADSMFKQQKPRTLVSPSDITQLAGDLSRIDQATMENNIQVQERLPETDNTGGRSIDVFNDKVLK